MIDIIEDIFINAFGFHFDRIIPLANRWIPLNDTAERFCESLAE